MDNVIASRELQVQRKNIHFEFRQNGRGEFLRMTEKAHSLPLTVRVPSTASEEFSATIDEMRATARGGVPA